MPVVNAGEQVVAHSLREQLPLLGYAASDVTITQSIDTTVIPGMAVVVEPLTAYAFDGYLAYESATTPKLVITTLALNGADGHWATYCLDDASGTTGSGPVDARQTLGFGSLSNVQQGLVYGFNAAGGTGIAYCALPTGYVTTSYTGGVLQFAFIQHVADAGATTIKAGSWIRAQKIGGA